MSREGNSVVNISSDGSVSTYDRHGVKIKSLCGDLPMLHKIIRTTQMNSKDKAKLPSNMKLYNPTFYIIREDTQEGIEVPIQHVIQFIEHIQKGDVEEFITNLSLQIPK